MDAALPTEQPLSHQAITARNRSAPGQVTGRLKTALMCMVWDGATRTEAAAKAGLKDHALYSALRKPHVKAFYQAELVVLRENERARNIHALVEVRDQKSNQMARVQAVKALEQISDEAEQNRPSGVSASPGVTIRIVNVMPAGHDNARQPVTVDAEPADRVSAGATFQISPPAEGGGKK